MKKIYRKPDLAALGVPYTDTHLLRLEVNGKFPKRFKLIPNSGKQGAVGWHADAIDGWIAERGSEAEDEDERAA